MKTNRLDEIELELVGLCNATCCYCRWQDKPKEFQKYMTADLASRIMREADEMEVSMVRYHGIGESTLHPLFRPIVEDGLRYTRIEHSVSTNCSMLQGRLADWLCRQEPLEVILAIPWVEHRVDFLYKCMRNAYNYLLLKPTNKLINVQMVCHENVAHALRPFLDRFYPIVSETPNAMISLKQPRTWPGDEPQHGFAPDIKMEKVWVDPAVTPRSAGAGCWMPSRVLMVMADGTCSPCCSSVEDWKYGNITSSNLMMIWNSERARFVRDAWARAQAGEVVDTPCGHCMNRTDCHKS